MESEELLELLKALRKGNLIYTTFVRKYSSPVQKALNCRTSSINCETTNIKN